MIVSYSIGASFPNRLAVEAPSAKVGGHQVFAVGHLTVAAAPAVTAVGGRKDNMIARGD
jgi:hypothetical protein